MSRILAVGSKESLSRLNKVDSDIVPLQMIRFEPVSFSFPETRFDWVFFGSRRGVQYFMEAVPREAMAGIRLGCIGEKTAEALHQRGMEAEFVPSRYSSTWWPGEFLEQFPGAFHILFPTSDRSTFESPDSFEERGIHFRKLVVYRTLCADISFPEGDFQGAVFASPSCFSCFVEKWGRDVLREKMLVAIGDVTAEEILDAGLSCSIPGRFTMADAIIHCRKRLESL